MTATTTTTTTTTTPDGGDDEQHATTVVVAVVESSSSPSSSPSNHHNNHHNNNNSHESDDGKEDNNNNTTVNLKLITTKPNRQVKIISPLPLTPSTLSSSSVSSPKEQNNYNEHFDNKKRKNNNHKTNHKNISIHRDNDSSKRKQQQQQEQQQQYQQYQHQQNNNNNNNKTDMNTTASTATTTTNSEDHHTSNDISIRGNNIVNISDAVVVMENSVDIITDDNYDEDDDDEFYDIESDPYTSGGLPASTSRVNLISIDTQSSNRNKRRKRKKKKKKQINDGNNNNNNNINNNNNNNSGVGVGGGGGIGNDDIDEETIYTSFTEPILHHLKSFVKIYWQLLTNRKFFWLFLSNFISTFGNFFTNIAILTLVNTYSSENSLSGIAISGVYMALFIPPVLLMPITGVVTDLFDRRKLMLASDLLRCFLVLLFLIVTLIDTRKLLWMIYPILTLMSSVNAFFDPCRESMIPVIIEDKSQLVAANALDSLTWMTCMFLGSSIGGFVNASLGPTMNFVIDAVSFLFSAFFVLQLLLTPNFYGLDGQEGATSSGGDIQHKIQQGNRIVKVSDFDRDIKMGRVHKDFDIETNDDSDLMSATSTTSHMSRSTNPDSHMQHVISLRRMGDDLATNISIDLPDIDGPAKVIKPSIATRMKNAIKNHGREFLIGIRFIKNNGYLLSLCLLKSTGILIWGGVIELIALKFSDTFFKIGSDASTMLGIVKAVVGIGSGLAPVIIERTVTIILENRRQKRMKRSGIEEAPNEIWDPNVSRGIIVFCILALTVGNLLVYISPSIHLTLFILGFLLLGSGAGTLWAVSSTTIFYVCPKELLGRTTSLDVGFFLSISQIISVTGGGVIYDAMRMTNAQPLVLIYIALGFIFTTVWSVWWIYFKEKPHETLPMPETTVPGGTSATIAPSKGASMSIVTPMTPL